MSTMKIAFEPPERSLGGCASKAGVIDFEHLARQTMGDKDLEAEVLRLFAREARGSLDRLAHEPAVERQKIAHRLKGAARGVGAFAIAEAAEAVELHPADPAQLSKLARNVTAAEDLISSLLR